MVRPPRADPSFRAGVARISGAAPFGHGAQAPAQLRRGQIRIEVPLARECTRDPVQLGLLSAQPHDLVQHGCPMWMQLVLLQQFLDVTLQCIRVVQHIGQAATEQMAAAPVNAWRHAAGALVAGIPVRSVPPRECRGPPARSGPSTRRGPG